MIKECKTCGTRFNDESVNRCPACRMPRKQIWHKDPAHDIKQFMYGEISEKRKVGNSTIRSEFVRSEIQHK